MLDIRPLNSELQKIANENLHETLDKVEDEVPALKDWIRNSAHLRARTDEQFLIAFLRFCHYDLEKAKEQIDAFYTLRTNIPEIIKGEQVDILKAFISVLTKFYFVQIEIP
mgnify:CR=1 FL=1